MGSLVASWRWKSIEMPTKFLHRLPISLSFTLSLKINVTLPYFLRSKCPRIHLEHLVFAKWYQYNFTFHSRFFRFGCSSFQNSKNYRVAFKRNFCIIFEKYCIGFECNLWTEKWLLIQAYWEYFKVLYILLCAGLFPLLEILWKSRRCRLLSRYQLLVWGKGKVSVAYKFFWSGLTHTKRGSRLTLVLVQEPCAPTYGVPLNELVRISETERTIQRALANAGMPVNS